MFRKSCIFWLRTSARLSFRTSDHPIFCYSTIPNIRLFRPMSGRVRTKRDAPGKHTYPPRFWQNRVRSCRNKKSHCCTSERTPIIRVHTHIKTNALNGHFYTTDASLSNRKIIFFSFLSLSLDRKIIFTHVDCL